VHLASIATKFPLDIPSYLSHMLFPQLFLALLSAVVITDEEKEEASTKVSSTDKSERIAAISSPTLNSSWSLWYDLQPKRGLQLEDYRKLLQKVGTFDTISGFWNSWNQLFQNIPDQVCSFQVFKEGVGPIWEHESNIHGGKWVITKGSESQVNDNIKDWLALVLSMIAGGLGFDEDLCGAVLSIRTWGISITIWNKDSTNVHQITDVSEKLKALLGIEQVRYQPHQTALQRKGVQRHASFHAHPQRNAKQQPTNQPQKSKQSKKKVERAQSAPAVLSLDQSPKQQQQQSQPAKKKNPRQRRQKQQEQPNAANQQRPHDVPRKGSLETLPLPPSTQSPGTNINETSTNAAGTKKSKHGKKRNSKKNQPKTGQPSSPTATTTSSATPSTSSSSAASTAGGADGVSHKLVDFVKPLTSMPIDRKLGISILIGATLTAMYIL